MSKVKISTLKESDLFLNRGVLYEIIYKYEFTSFCRYLNDKGNVDHLNGKYLYCSFSNNIKVEI